MDVWKLTPVFYSTSALWGHYPALTSHHLNTPKRATGAADHVQASDVLFITAQAHPQCDEDLGLDNFEKQNLTRSLDLSHVRQHF